VNQPQVKAVIGDFKLCETMATFDAKKFAEFQGKVCEGFLMLCVFCVLNGSRPVCMFVVGVYCHTV
jgi:hypothetical protein